MKVQITKDFDINRFKSEVEQNLPDYKTHMRGKNILVVEKSGTAAALVVKGRGGFVRVNEGFPSMGGQMLFTLCLILLGILIPLIIYFAAFYSKQKAVRDDVANLVRRIYTEGSGNPDTID